MSRSHITTLASENMHDNVGRRRLRQCYYFNQLSYCMFTSELYVVIASFVIVF